MEPFLIVMSPASYCSANDADNIPIANNNMPTARFITFRPFSMFCYKANGLTIALAALFYFICTYTTTASCDAFFVAENADMIPKTAPNASGDFTFL